MAEYSVIGDRTEFEDACRALAAADGPVAVDVERASGFRYSQRAYLVQVFRRGAGVYLFDPPALGDFTALQEAIGDAEWVFHAASQDLPSLRELGLEPDAEAGEYTIGGVVEAIVRGEVEAEREGATGSLAKSQRRKGRRRET